jgi:tetratricopeptide (TPR) repeat protein
MAGPDQFAAVRNKYRNCSRSNPFATMATSERLILPEIPKYVPRQVYEEQERARQLKERAERRWNVVRRGLSPGDPNDVPQHALQVFTWDFPPLEFTKYPLNSIYYLTGDEDGPPTPVFVNPGFTRTFPPSAEINATRGKGREKSKSAPATKFSSDGRRYHLNGNGIVLSESSYSMHTDVRGVRVGGESSARKSTGGRGRGDIFNIQSDTSKRRVAAKQKNWAKLPSTNAEFHSEEESMECRLACKLAAMQQLRGKLIQLVEDSEIAFINGRVLESMKMRENALELRMLGAEAWETYQRLLGVPTLEDQQSQHSNLLPENHPLFGIKKYTVQEFVSECNEAASYLLFQETSRDEDVRGLLAYAEDLTEESCKLIRNFKRKHRLRGLTYHNIASVEIKHGNYRAAFGHAKQSLEFYERAKTQVSDRVPALLNYGVLLSRFGKHVMALQCARMAAAGLHQMVQDQERKAAWWRRADNVIHAVRDFQRGGKGQTLATAVLGAVEEDLTLQVDTATSGAALEDPSPSMSSHSSDSFMSSSSNLLQSMREQLKLTLPVEEDLGLNPHKLLSEVAGKLETSKTTDGTIASTNAQEIEILMYRVRVERRKEEGMHALWVPLAIAHHNVAVEMEAMGNYGESEKAYASALECAALEVDDTHPFLQVIRSSAERNRLRGKSQPAVCPPLTEFYLGKGYVRRNVSGPKAKTVRLRKPNLDDGRLIGPALSDQQLQTARESHKPRFQYGIAAPLPNQPTPREKQRPLLCIPRKRDRIGSRKVDPLDWDATLLDRETFEALLKK